MIIFDYKVGYICYRELILKFLKNRTCILVSHQISLAISAASLVVCLNRDGTLAACCPPELLQIELAKFNCDEFADSKSFIEREDRLDVDARSSTVGYPKKVHGSQSFQNIVLDLQAASSISTSTINDNNNSYSKLSDSSQMNSDLNSKNIKDVSVLNSVKILDDGQNENKIEMNDNVMGIMKPGLISVEERATGDVRLSVYLDYLRAGQGLIAVFVLVSLCLSISTAWYVDYM